MLASHADAPTAHAVRLLGCAWHATAACAANSRAAPPPLAHRRSMSFNERNKSYSSPFLSRHRSVSSVWAGDVSLSMLTSTSAPHECTPG